MRPLPFALCSTFVVAAVRGEPLSAELVAFGCTGANGLLLLTLLKLGSEASVFLHLRGRQQGDLKRTALLLWGELRHLTCYRFVLGIVGGIVLPMVFLTTLAPSRAGLALVASLLSLACLVTGEILERMSFFTALSAPRKLAPNIPYVEISPQDAAHLGISADAWGIVRSQRGMVKARAFVSHVVQPGQVFMPMHFARTNQLTLTSFAPYSRQPSYKACAVRIEVAPNV